MERKSTRIKRLREMAVQGGLKGGAARAAALTPERRSEIARKAALARWAKVQAAPADE